MNIHHTPDEIDALAAAIAYAGKVGDADLTPVVEMLQQGAAALRRLAAGGTTPRSLVAVTNALVTAHNEHLQRMTALLNEGAADPVEVTLFVRTTGDALNRLLTAGFPAEASA